MPDYGKDREGPLTRQAIEYWAREYRKLRIRDRLGITFETFLELDRSTRHNVQAWMLRSLRDWRENPRWLAMANTPLVLDWKGTHAGALITSLEIDRSERHPN